MNDLILSDTPLSDDTEKTDRDWHERHREAGWPAYSSGDMGILARRLERELSVMLKKFYHPHEGYNDGECRRCGLPSEHPVHAAKTMNPFK